MTATDPSDNRRVRGLFRMPIFARWTGRRPARATLLSGLVFLVLPIGCELLTPEHPADNNTLSHQPLESREIVARGSEPATPPGKYWTRRGYYVFYHDFEFDSNDPVFASLESLPEEVFSELRLPASNPNVQVFLFDTQDRYERFMKQKYPSLPPRRAYFLQEPLVGGKNDLKAYTYLGAHLRTDLRHELTHALLHGVLKDVPLWLDEGLAGYFELPPGNDGINPQHLDFLRHGAFQPNLARLEKLVDVKQMEKPEYREAWAWVHFMLQSEPAVKKVLLDYLQALRTDSNPGLLLPRLREVLLDPEQYLLDHLNTIEWPPVPGKGH